MWRESEIHRVCIVKRQRERDRHRRERDTFRLRDEREGQIREET